MCKILSEIKFDVCLGSVTLNPFGLYTIPILKIVWMLCKDQKQNTITRYLKIFELIFYSQQNTEHVTCLN